MSFPRNCSYLAAQNSCFLNSYLWVIRHGEIGTTECGDETFNNPFVVTHLDTEVIWEGKAHLINPDALSSRERNEFGATENQLLEIQVLDPELELPTGYWLILKYCDRLLITGYLKSINRKLSKVSLYLDSSKPLPFDYSDYID